MPLANTRSRVELVFEHLSDGDFIRVQSFLGDREKYRFASGALVHINAARIAAGHQTGSGRRTDAAGDIKARKAHTFGGHAVEVRRAMLFRPEAAEVAVTQIITENNNEVRLVHGAICGLCRTRAHRARPARQHRPGGRCTGKPQKIPTTLIFLHHNLSHLKDFH